MRRTYKLLVHALPIVDNSVQFYRKCVTEIREFFELPQDKRLDGSFGPPSKETIDSLEMIGEVLRETIFDLSVPETSEVKLLSKAFTTKVNEHLFAKARELGLNEAVGCLDFAINFPSIVEEVMKRITKLPFLFYTHPPFPTPGSRGVNVFCSKCGQPRKRICFSTIHLSWSSSPLSRQGLILVHHLWFQKYLISHIGGLLFKQGLLILSSWAVKLNSISCYFHLHRAFFSTRPLP